MGSANTTIRKPFIDHIRELRVRFFWVILSVTAAAGAAFTINEQLLVIIQKPLHQTLYFTSPTGGLSFIFQLCITVGIVVAFPVIVYHLYQFISPLLAKQKRIVIFVYILTSFIMACLGVVFAYFISLPAALHFLTQFGGAGIESLIKADEYFSFALTYIAGFAIMFQIPLLVLFINKIKPLGPGGMMKSQRWVILVSFIGAALITPTPDPINQALMAAPAVALYQVSILLVMIVNRGRKTRVMVPKPASTVSQAAVLNAPFIVENSPFLNTLKPARPSKRIVSDIISQGAVIQQRRQVVKPVRQAPNLTPIRPRYAQPSRQPMRILNRPIQSIDGII